MRPILSILLAALVLMAPMAAQGRPTEVAKSHKSTSTNTRNVLEAVACNASAALRTITIPLGGLYGRVKLFLWLDHTAATTLTVTPSESTDGTNYADLSSRAVASGTGTVSTYVDSKAAGADIDMVLEYNVQGLEAVKYLIGGASCGASDLVDAQWVAIP